MENVLKNRRNMYMVVHKVCKKYNAVWQHIPEFVNSMNELNAALEQFTSIAEERLKDTKHITEQKNALMEKLTDRIYIIVKLIRAYALSNDKQDLLNEYSLTKESLIRGGAKSTVNRFANVMKKAKTLDVELKDFGLSTSQLTGLCNQVDEARVMILQPRMTILSRKMQTRKLKILSKHMSAIVKIKLTAMVELMQNEHPEFYDQFMDARNILDTRGPRKNGVIKTDQENIDEK